jgi:hypothetical protein
MSDRFTIEELQAALAKADRGAVLVAPRFLRRVIRLDRDLPGLGLLVPHRKSYVVARDAARTMLRPEEAPELHKPHIPPVVMLLAGPDAGRLGRTPREEVLRNYSRRLFHVRLDRFFKTEWPHIENRAEVRERIARIGQAAFDEIRATLRDENYLLPPVTDAQVYAEFCAVFFEFERYAPKLLPQYFPSIHDLSAMSSLLKKDVPADELYKRTLLAEEVEPGPSSSRNEAPVDPWDTPALRQTKVQALRYRYHRSRAIRAGRAGNDVRCMLQNAAAYRVAPFPYVEEAKAGVEEAVARLARRLTKALQVDDAGAESIARLLPTLLPAASGGPWNEPARILFDLQNACIDREKDHFIVDIWAWALSLGRVPLKRPLPYLPEVLAARHLRSAARRIARVTMPRELRDRWLQVVRTAAHAAAEVVRTKFGTILEQAFKANGLEPGSAVDRVAFDKVVGETLDVVVAKGRFSLSDLRDVVARNDVKLPDVQDFRDFRTGGALLRINRALAYAFDGVYRGGEFYLRWLLQFTSLAYGTKAGRFITRHFALPVGGAIMIAEGLQHTLFVAIKLALRSKDELHFANWWTIAFIALVIYGCIHSREFAARMWKFAKWIGSGLKRVFLDWPYELLQWPKVQKFIHSTSFVLLRRAVLYPLAISFAAIEVAPIVANTFLHVVWPHRVFEVVLPTPPLEYLPVAFVVAAAVFISPLGRKLEELVLDRLTWTWRRLRFDLFPGIVRVIVEFFHLLLEWMERMLYAVDERLRFHTGETQWSLVWKAAVSSVWRIVEYAIRTVVNLVVEPQVNPVKHFPVVTVSHKIMLPAVPAVQGALSPIMGPVNAGFTTGTLTIALPGVCGFLAWELLMNWRLYEATRPDALKPAPIGSHGETMTRLLRPGFHSGTIPKLFAKMRKARRQEQWGASPSKIDRLEDQLEHVAESIELFVRRELIRTLVEHPAWKEHPPTAEHVALGSNRAVAAISCSALGDKPLRIAFEEQSGWLAAGIVDSGWLASASESQRKAFAWALTGFYKRCGVPIVREQLEAALHVAVADVDSYDVTDHGLLVWRRHPDANETTYDLWTEGDVAEPQPPSPAAKPLALRDAIFSRTVLTWSAWSAYWNAAAERDDLPPGRVLPGE